MSRKSKRKTGPAGAPPKRSARAQRDLQAAVAAQQIGDLAEAERLYQAVLAAVPDQPQALHFYGLLAQHTGRPELALDCLRRAAALAPGDPQCQNNLANVLKESGRTEEAIEAYRAALARKADHVTAWFNLGHALLDTGDAEGAEQAFRRVLALTPGDAEALNSLGTALMTRGARSEAGACFAKALSLDPRLAAAHHNRGLLLKQGGRWAEALGAFEAANRLRPDSPDTLRQLGECYRALKRLPAAEAALARVVRLSSDDASAHHNHALVLGELGRAGEAVEAWRRALALDPASGEAWTGLGYALTLASRMDEALEAHAKALALTPDAAAAHSNLALTHLDMGDFAAAEAEYRKAIDLDPRLADAYLGLAGCRRFGPDDRALIEGMAALGADPALDEDQAIDLNFALGKIHDDLGEYDEAFRRYRAANDALGRQLPVQRELHVETVERSIELFTPGFFAEREGFGDPASLPVFVLGMPRSGTTLVEQIIASHPAAAGGGELPHIPALENAIPRRLGTDAAYPVWVPAIDRALAAELGAGYLDELRRIGPQARRVTDKLPANYLYLGLIALLLPNARIVHCRRDPIDTALSIYFQKFSHGHYYACSLGDIAFYYRQYRRLMAHWREVLPLPIHEVRYETLVADTEAQSRELLEFVGLPWDDKCLEFYKTKRAVQTASHWQARQPVYKRSVERWRRYEKHIGELKSLLDEPDA